MILPPLPAGVTAVTGVRLYSDEVRTQNEQSLPAALVDGRWTVDTLNVPVGRWWATVDAVQGVTPYVYPLTEPVDLPEDDRLVVSPEALASKMGMTLPLTSAQRATLTDAILDAQSDVAAYLGRDSLMPVQHVETGLWAIDDEWNLHTDEEVISVLSAVAEVDVDNVPLGTFTVTYLAGLNVRDNPTLHPIKRFIISHAKNLPETTEMWRVATNTKGRVKTVSAEGQSVTFDTPTLGGGGKTGSGDPGSLPGIGKLDRWRIAGRRVHQGATQFGVRYR